MGQRIAGILQLQVDGEVFLAKGTFTTNLGAPMRESVVGADRVHGYKETPQVPSIDGEITDDGTLPRARVLNITDATVTLTQANGKMFTLYGAWFAGEGLLSTDESSMACRFEGMDAEEVAT